MRGGRGIGTSPGVACRGVRRAATWIGVAATVGWFTFTVTVTVSDADRPVDPYSQPTPSPSRSRWLA